MIQQMYVTVNSLHILSILTLTIIVGVSGSAHD